MPKAKERDTWLPTPEQMAKAKERFVKDYFNNADVYNTPYGTGYWLYGVTFNKKIGWLAYEFDEQTEIPDNMDHEEAVDAFEDERPLPPKYFLMDKAFWEKAYSVGVRRWGECFYADTDYGHVPDLPEIDLIVQWVLLGEIKYG